MNYEVLEKNRKKIGDYLKSCREQKNIGLNQLSLKTNINKSLISRLENGKLGKINPFMLKKIASALNVDYKKLYTIVGYLEEEDFNFKNKKEIKKSEIKFIDAKIVELPVYGKASAGKGHINLEAVLKYKKVIDDGFSPDSFLVEVSGDSMATLINDEDIVIVDPQLNDYVAGKIYVITYNDETYIKQVQCPKKNMIVLKSLNSDYEDKYIVDEEIKELKVEGRVVKVITEKKL